MSQKTDEQYQALMSQLWEGREKPKPVDWQAKFRELKDLSCTVSYMDPLNEKIMLVVRDAERAYKHNDEVVFNNCLQIIRELKYASP